VVDLESPLDEQFLDVAIREAEAQVSADRDDDHLGWEPEAGEGRVWNRSRARLASSHATSLAKLTRSQPMQQRLRWHKISLPAGVRGALV
jgi:hypothetical protein